MSTTYYGRTTDRRNPGQARPPHPFIVAADALEAKIRAVPPKAWEVTREQHIVLLARQRGARFAGIIDWALRERLSSRDAKCKEGCGRVANCRGWCDTCYARHRRRGAP
jgi:hypothetical protein